MIGFDLDADYLVMQKALKERLAAMNFAKIAPRIAEVVKNSIDRNFSEQGRFGKENVFGGGTNKWIESKAAKKRSGQTLSKTGHLARSIISSVRVKYENGKIEITLGSNLAYAAIHQFGGKINFPARSRLYKQNRYKKDTKKGKKGQFRKGRSKEMGGITTPAYSIAIPARPFLVLQNQDIELIHQIINEFIRQELN